MTVSRWATVVLFLASDHRDVAARHRSRGVGVPARARRRDGSRADPPLVLVAHQRVERDQRDDRVVRRLARLRMPSSCKPRFPAGDPRARRVGRCSITVAVSTVVWLASPSSPRPSRTQLDVVLRAGAAGRPGLARVSRRGSATAASRFPAARWPGRTGSPASSPSTPACSASASSSSARSMTGVVMLVIAAARVRLDRPSRSARRTPACAASGTSSAVAGGLSGNRTAAWRMSCTSAVTRLNHALRGVYT